MGYPTKYTRQFDYSSYQNANPTRPLPADKVNADLNQVALSSKEVIDFLKGISRADGKLANGSVGYDQLSAALQTNGVAGANAWLTGTIYSVGSAVVVNGNLYRAAVAHVSTVFATDLAANKWVFIAAISAFTQTGSSAVELSYEAIFRGKIYTPEMFGAVADPMDTNSGLCRDNTKALNDCMAELCRGGLGAMILGPGVYKTSTGVSITNHNVSIIGCGGRAATILFMPIANNGAGVTVQKTGSGAGGTINNIRLMDFAVSSADTTFSKTGVNLIDLSHGRVENIMIMSYPGGGGYFTGGGGGCTGLHIQGRETSTVSNIFSVADFPLIVDVNPNFAGISLDSFNFGPLELFASGLNPCVMVRPGVVLFNTNFNGPNNWIGRGPKFQWIDTTSTTYSSGLTVRRVKSEPGSSDPASGWVIDIEHNFGLYGFEFDGGLGGDVAGFKLRKVKGAKLRNYEVRFPGNLGLVGVDADASCETLQLEQMQWHSSTVSAISGLILKRFDPSPTGAALPLNAFYSTNAAAQTFDAITVVNNAEAGTFNNMGITHPAVTANFTPGSGKTFGILSSIFFQGTDGQTHTFQNSGTIVSRDSTDTLTNKTINGANNTLNVRIGADVSGLGTGLPVALGIAVGSAGAPVLFNGAGGTPLSINLANASGITTANFAANVVDNDSALTANSSTRLPTQAAVVAYLAARIAAMDLMLLKGGIDCSGNPNYPAADAGWFYKVTVAGKIGGASGPNVEAGDTLLCFVDGTAAGNQATVGANWIITQVNIDGAVSGPASSTSGNLASFNGTGGKLIQDSGKAVPAGTIVGTSDTQTLTGKTVALGSNTVSGTTAQFNAALTDNDFATVAGTETLTGKTIAGANNTLNVRIGADVAGLGTGLPVALQQNPGTAGGIVLFGGDDGTHAATTKATPVDADELSLFDSAASFVRKKLTWANLKATLKAYFDGLYAPLDTAAWTAYTPALFSESGGAIGTPTSIAGRYKLSGASGKTCQFQAKVVMGATGVGTATQISISTPFTAVAEANVGMYNSTQGLSSVCPIGQVSFARVFLIISGGARGAGNNDTFWISGSFETV